MKCYLTVPPALLLAGAVLLGVVTSPARANDNEPYPQITVNGQGSAQLAPDMALLQLMVTREADTARAALDANSAAMAGVIKALRGQGIAERDLQTSGFSIQPRYRQPAPAVKTSPQDEDRTPRIVGYTVRNGLVVRVRDLDNLGAIVDQSVTLGVNEGGDIQFANDDPSAALEQARTRAVQDAVAKAKTLAAAAGVKLGRVLAISEHSFAPAPASPMRAGMLMAKSAEAVPVAAGENSYEVTVNLSYAIDQ